MALLFFRPAARRCARESPSFLGRRCVSMGTRGTALARRSHDIVTLSVCAATPALLQRSRCAPHAAGDAGADVIFVSAAAAHDAPPLVRGWRRWVLVAGRLARWYALFAPARPSGASKGRERKGEDRGAQPPSLSLRSRCGRRRRGSCRARATRGGGTFCGRPRRRVRRRPSSRSADPPRPGGFSGRVPG